MSDGHKSKEGRIRFYCERCKKYYVEGTIDISVLKKEGGVYAYAFNHGDHVITVYFDDNFITRNAEPFSSAPEEKKKEKKKKDKDLDWFDGLQD